MAPMSEMAPISTPPPPPAADKNIARKEIILYPLSNLSSPCVQVDA
jgi:hypothetical protein